jgi:hypothetical protein
MRWSPRERLGLIGAERRKARGARRPENDHQPDGVPQLADRAETDAASRLPARRAARRLG